MINFDANACYGILPELVEELKKFDYSLLNPSSIHRKGQAAKALIEDARNKILNSLKLSVNEYRVVFTSGASEANSMALFYPFWNQFKGSLLTTKIEHHSVLETAERLAACGVDVDYIPVNNTFNADNLESCQLISMMAANNETGEILDLKKIKSFIPDNCIFHSDCVQAYGKIEYDYSIFDMFSISGHKIGALTGIGALIVKKNLAPERLIFGGPQEQRWRAGTENVIGIYSFAKAAELLTYNLATRINLLLERKEKLINVLKNSFNDLCFNSFTDSLVNTISVRIPGIYADDLVVAADLEGLAISSGSACQSGKPLASHVLLAMGQSEMAARETIRISLNHHTSEKDFQRGLEILETVIKKMKIK